MPTIIDSLLVTLGLDASGMKAGAKEAEAVQEKLRKDADTTDKAKKKKTAEDIAAEKKLNEAKRKATKQQEADSKRVAEGLSKIRNEVLALGVAYVGIKAMTDINQNNVGVGKAASKLGIDTETLSAWQGAANKFNASAEDVTDAFANINKIQQDIKLTGQSGAMNPLFRAGVDPKFFKDTTSAEEKILLLQKAFSKLSAPMAQALGTQAGFSGDFVLMMQAPKKALLDEVDLQKQLYIVTKKNADASKELDTEIGHLTSGLKGVGNEILMDLHPALLTAIKDLEKLTALARENPKTTEAVVATGVAVGGIFTVVKIAKWVGALRNVIGALGAVKEAAVVAGEATEAVTGTAATAEAATGVAAIGETIAGGITLAGGSLMTGALVMLGGISAGMGYMLAKFYKKVFGESEDKTPWYKKAFGVTDGIDHEAIAKAKAESTAAGMAAAHVSSPIFHRSTKEALRAEAEKEMAQARKDAGYAPSNENAASLAKASEAKYGVPAAVTLAQYQLESKSGKKMPVGSNNPFGIKASKSDIASGHFVEAMTTEVINGVEIRLLQKFKKFDSLADAFDAHAKLLATSKYYAKARANAGDKNAYADALTGVYATDPEYGAKLKKLMRPGNAIDRSLMPGAAGAVAQNSGNTSTNTNTSEVKIGSITVNTKATDAPGISKDIGASLQQYAFASNANVGLK